MRSKLISASIYLGYVLSITGLFIISCTSNLSTPKPLGDIKKADIIKQYLDGGINDIEGIWIWSDNSFEVAIIKNTFDIYSEYDYIAVITDTHLKNWEHGELKFLLKITADRNTFTASYFSDIRTKNRYATQLVMNSLIAARFKAGALLVKTYPKFEEHK